MAKYGGFILVCVNDQVSKLEQKDKVISSHFWDNQYETGIIKLHLEVCSCDYSDYSDYSFGWSFDISRLSRDKLWLPALFNPGYSLHLDAAMVISDFQHGDHLCQHAWQIRDTSEIILILSWLYSLCTLGKGKNNIMAPRKKNILLFSAARSARNT